MVRGLGGPTSTWSSVSHAPLITQRVAFLQYTFIFSILSFVRVDFINTMMICPTPEPCHCIGDEVIFCAFQQLQNVPYILEFYADWEVFNLSDNLISRLPAEGLRGVRVNTLDLSRNALSSFDITAFLGVEKLYTVDMSFNRLSDLPTGLLAPLQHLQCLKLRYNSFTKLTPGVFTTAPQLLELDLTGNDLTSIPTEALRPLVRLKKLWLRHNKLKNIDNAAFPSLPLEFLDLGDNSAPLRLEPSAFCDLKPQISQPEPNVKDWTGIQTLLLDHNGLSHLDPCIVKFIWTIQLVDLSGNPLRCDCRLYLLKNWSTRTTYPEAQCAVPYRFAGQYIDQLDPKAFNCKFSTLQLNQCDDICEEPNEENSVNPLFSLQLNYLLVLAVLQLTL